MSSVKAQKHLDICRDEKCVVCGERIGSSPYETSVTKPFTFKGVYFKKKEVYAHTRCLTYKNL